MTRAAVLRRKAEDDIGSAFQWYEMQQPGLGDDFLVRLRQSLEGVGRLPESFPLTYRNVRRALVTKYPYVVFFVAETTRVVVLAVLHTSRNPAVWPRR